MKRKICEGTEGLGFRLGLAKTDDLVTGLELATLLQEFDTLKTLQHVAFGSDCTGAFQAAMLGHKINKLGQGKYGIRGARVKPECG